MNIEKKTAQWQEPELHTPRLLLRPFRLTDAPAVKELAGDKEIAAATIYIPHPYTMADAEKWLNSHEEDLIKQTAQHYAIVGKDGKLMGAITLKTNLPHSHAEIGYWIGKNYWGQQYATEAAGAIKEYGFRHLKLNRLYAYCFKSNPASARILEKIGMELEGIMKQHDYKWGKFEDLCIYGCLNTLPQATRNTTNRKSDTDKMPGRP